MFFYIGVMVDIIVGRVQALREDDEKDLGASAIEWAIIAAISVILAVAIGVVIYNVVDTKKTQITNCGNAAPGQDCNP